MTVSFNTSLHPTATSLAADHAFCTDVMKKSGSSFAIPIALLPRSKRLATQSLYAFCRLADDLVDQRDSVDSASQAIDSLEQSLHAALAGKSVADPRVRALAAASHQYGIPREHLVAILDGVRMDLDAQLYKTSKQLEHYCEHVASAVGLAAIHIWGFRTWEAIEPARQCGLAFQMTNILRDIQEDLQRGKIYLPTDDFARCGCDPADLRAGRIGPEFNRLADLELDRTRDYFDRCRSLDGLLATDGRLVFRAMFGVYRAMFEILERHRNELFGDRITIGKQGILFGALKAIVMGTGRAGGRIRAFKKSDT